MKNWKIWAVLVIVVLSFIFIKMFLLKPKEEKSKSAPNKAMPISTTAYVVKEEKMSQQLYVTGEIVPINEIALRPEISGKIVSINFKDGEYKNKGALLVKINDADLQAQLLKVEAQFKLAQQRLDRVEKLRLAEGISQEEVDINSNEISTLNADRAFLKAQIAKTSITAPFAGVVGLKEISQGAFVTNMDVIASLVQTQPVYIDFSIPERYASLVKKGISITFQNENHAGTTTKYKAAITAIEPRIDPITKTLKCRATYYGKEQLYVGAFVKVYVNFGEIKNSILIPTQSVIPILKGQKVFVARNGTAQEVKITTGIRTDKSIQVLDSLQMGDTVLTSGLMSIKQGSKLKIVKIQ